jgi:hypothetical protein
VCQMKTCVAPDEKITLRARLASFSAPAPPNTVWGTFREGWSGDALSAAAADLVFPDDDLRGRR